MHGERFQKNFISRDFFIFRKGRCSQNPAINNIYSLLAELHNIAKIFGVNMFQLCVVVLIYVMLNKHKMKDMI
jgi:hypothetical protein